ncbi:MAG: hypothetical protein ACTIA2_08325 [Brevibacterium aurantiacum]|uniref:hypothetical protein n=1 Tax=Brevibacterium aurantiacum TaxID=273384 RepID=UPI000DF1DD89|nr:hypothetical protein [Brevibacterium aurantiacum]RCS87914.1 hypothetical protein CIK63_12065 [Brevibacterium aurantiacum]RCS93472.1 hypothetical protein CIK61_15365 [Brevibacterium aurantiacum]
MRKLSIKRLVILAIVSAGIFTVIAFGIDARIGWVMSLVFLVVLLVAWVGVFVKAFARSLLTRLVPGWRR